MKCIYERFKKRTLLFLLIIHFSIVGFAATYYVSNTGNDSNSGLTTALPWQTLTKVNGFSFKPGDQILFNRGDTFYGTITVKNSGASGNPITFGAYGTGVNPVITGFTTVTAWTNLGNNIWESTNAVSTLSTCNMVIVNGVNTAMGRYPNSGAAWGGYLAFQSHTGSTSITTNSLTGTPDWTGADIVIRLRHWLMDRHSITSQSAGTLNFSATAQEPLDGYGFFIQNDIRTLDTQNEWYFNPSTKKISIYSNSQPINVKVAAIDNLMTLTGNYLTVNGIDFVGSNAVAVTSIGTYLTFENCSILFAGKDFIWSSGIRTQLTDNIFNTSNNNGVSIGGSNSSILRNTIQNVCLFPGMSQAGYSGLNSSLAFSAEGQHGFDVENNTIINSGMNGMSFYGDTITVRNNFIDSYCLTLDDAGGIYTYTGSRAKMKQVKINGNIVINGMANGNGTSGGFVTNSSGIYCDNKTGGVEVYNNSVFSCTGYAVFFNDNTDVNFHDNTIYAGTLEQVYCNYSTGIIFNNNNVISQSGQYCMTISSGSDDIPLRITANNNNWCRPIDDTKTFYVSQPSEYGGGKYLKTLTEWQTFSGQDANSQKSPFPIASETDLRFEYNATTSAKTVTLSYPMVDIKGTKYPISVTLQPFTSVVLMKDPNPAKYSTEYKSICDGTSYNGWTIAGKYERTLTSKSGSDSIVTTFLTINPTYSLTEGITINQGETYNGWTKTGQYSRRLSSVSGCDSTIITNLTVDSLIIKQGSIAPTHFIPVWQGENGINHMNVMVVSATLEDLSLSPNDEIALFSGSKCVGSMKLTQAINPADNSTFLTIPASQDDGSNNGFTENDTILIKIWDSVNQREMSARKVNYRNNISSWLTTGRYSAGATSVIEVASYTEYTQTINLQKGYNLISTYVTAENPNVVAVTKPLCDQGSLIKVQDETGTSFENWGNFGGWVNNLGSLDIKEGYKIKVANNCMLQVTGRPIPLPLDIPLNAGWNIISFPRMDLVDAMNIIQPLIDQTKLIKVQDELGNSIENWGLFGGWVNGIGNFIPGKAYKVKMSGNAILTIQENYTKSAVITVNTESTIHFSTGFEGNGTDQMNINLVGLQEAGFSSGDEIAAYDNDVCVGTLKLTQTNFTNGTASLIASSSADGLVSDGFKSGDIIQLKFWNQLSGNEEKVQAEPLNGQLNYEKNGSVWAKLKLSTTNAQDKFADMMKIDVFPNPCKERVTVRFSTLPDAGSRIDILDISGRKVTSRFITDTSEEFSLGYQPAGMYLVKSVIGAEEVVRKLVIK